jgi:hypothetical protein
MQILFKNGVQVPIALTNSPAQDTLLSIYKHLQHVPIVFRDTDYPGQYINNTLDDLVDFLVTAGLAVLIDVDRELCLAKSQPYFNYLHKLYEKNYNGDPAWLVFHEHIHLCEYYIEGPLFNRMDINYREKTGLLNKPFDMSWMKTSTTQVSAGDVYIHWAELGKIPYLYWKHNEPDDINCLYKLAKPWLTFYPILTLALDNRDLLKNKNIKEFNIWWEQYSEQWCRHWNLSKWSIEDQYSVIVVGRVAQFDQVTDLLKNQIYPIKIQL